MDFTSTLYYMQFGTLFQLLKVPLNTICTSFTLNNVLWFNEHIGKENNMLKCRLTAQLI